MKQVTIQAIRKYHDIELQRPIAKGETYIVSFERAKQITDRNLAKVIEVKNIEVNKPKEVTPFISELNEKSKKELIEIAKKKGIKTSKLNKSELIKKLELN